MKKSFYLLVFILFSNKIFAQSVTINPLANNSSIINVQSTNKGVLVPNLTTVQRTAISTPQKGLLVFDTDINSFWFHNGTTWDELINKGTSIWSVSGTELLSSGFTNFNFSGGSNISALSGGSGTDGTLKVYTPGFLAGNYMNLDATSIQARSYSIFGGLFENNLKLNPFGANVGIGLGANAPTAKFHLGGNMKIDGTNTLELGAGVAGKETNAGKIGYQTFSTDALDIVGAGTGTATRKLTIWAEGGTTLKGGVQVNGSLTIKKSTYNGSNTQVLTALDRVGASILQFNQATSIVRTTLTGIANGVDGMVLQIIVNFDDPVIILGNPTGGGILTIANDNTVNELTPANRIITNSNAGNIDISGHGGATLIYDGSSSRWRVIGVAQ